MRSIIVLLACRLRFLTRRLTLSIYGRQRAFIFRVVAAALGCNCGGGVRIHSRTTPRSSENSKSFLDDIDRAFDAKCSLIHGNPLGRYLSPELLARYLVKLFNERLFVASFRRCCRCRCCFSGADGLLLRYFQLCIDALHFRLHLGFQLINFRLTRIYDLFPAAGLRLSRTLCFDLRSIQSLSHLRTLLLHPFQFHLKLAIQLFLSRKLLLQLTRRLFCTLAVLGFLFLDLRQLLFCSLPLRFKVFRLGLHGLPLGL
mmetsp:Transcript_1762/g.3187  ORF Transcript_1762/g.3187 Transcript_1762/m.3187 type:complete len:257 (+) Transcript_1762:536-1306(+)